MRLHGVPRSVLRCIGVLAAAVGVASFAACLGEDPPAATDGALEQDAAPGKTQPDPQADGSTTPTVPSSDAGGDAAPSTFCATAPRPDAGEFFCADFDGADVTAGLTRSSPDAGVVKRVTDIFFSAPASVEVSGGTTLVWEKSGGQPVAGIEARVRVNVGTLGGAPPAATGNVTLVELRTVDSQFSLNYARGATVEGSAYTGYYLRSVSCPNACAAFDKRVTGAPKPNLWSEVRLAWASNGAVQLSFDGVEGLPANYVSMASTTTKAGVSLGLDATANAPMMPRHAFDDLRVTVTRK